MKVAIYTRVSSQNQEIEGSSLETQLEACRKLAIQKGYEIDEDYIIREVYSGLTLDRPYLSKLRNWLDSGEISAVVIHAGDRFMRDGYDLITLKRHCDKAGVELLCVTDQLDNELVTFMLGWASRQEAEKIKERTDRGRKARIASGKLANGKASYLFGYDYIPGRGDGEGIRQVNPDQAKIVKDIFNWFTSEYIPLDRLVYRLRDLGVASPTGNRVWARASVYKLLTNLAYCGLITTPPILDKDTFNKAQARLKRNKELSARNVKREYLLRGYVFCSQCKRRYQGANKPYLTKEGIKEYQYYRCSSSFKVNARPCPNPSWKAEHLESMVWREIESVLSNPEVVLAGLKAIEDDAMQEGFLEQELRQVNSRLKELDREQEKLLELTLKGFPGEIVVKENAKINEARSELNQRKIELESRIEQAKQSQVNIEGIKRACQIVRSNLVDLSFENKRLALEALSVKVWLDGRNVTIEGAIPFVSTPSNRNGERMPSISACQLTQLGQSMPLGWGLPHLGQSGGIIRGND